MVNGYYCQKNRYCFLNNCLGLINYSESLLIEVKIASCKQPPTCNQKIIIRNVNRQLKQNFCSTLNLLVCSRHIAKKIAKENCFFILNSSLAQLLSSNQSVVRVSMKTNS